MALIRLTAPNPLMGDNLAAELRAAGFVVRGVTFYPLASRRPGQTLNEIEVDTDATLAQISPVVAAHTGLPTTPEQAADVIFGRLDTAITEMQNWVANASPVGSPLTPALTLDLVKMVIGLAKVVRGHVSDTTGT